VQILAARRNDRRVQTAIEASHHEQTRLAVITAGILPNHRRVPIELRHPLECQPALGNVLGVFRRVERRSRMEIMLQRKTDTVNDFRCS
jgi:hypothetical protein